MKFPKTIELSTVWGIVATAAIAYHSWLLHWHVRNVLELHYRLKDMLQTKGMGGLRQVIESLEWM